SSSLLFSCRLRGSWLRSLGWWRRLSSRRLLAGQTGFHDADRAIFRSEDLVGDAADVRLAYLIDAIDGAEELAPVTVISLVGGELRGKTLIVSEPANQIGF